MVPAAARWPIIRLLALPLFAVAGLALSLGGVRADTPEDDYDDVYDEGGHWGRVEVGGAVTGVLETAGDLDWFSVYLQAGRSYRIELQGASSGAGTLTDPAIEGVYAFALELADSRRSGGGAGLDARLDLAPAATTQYFIVAGSGDGGAGGYRLSVSELHPARSATLTLGYADDAERMQPYLRVGGAVWGYNSLFAFGALAPAEFTWQGQTYEVLALGLIVADGERRLDLLTRPALPDEFSLKLGSSVFPLSAAEHPSGAGAAYRWREVALDWVEGEQLALGLLAPYPELTLELNSSRELCTANTLTALNWEIAGGQPPYTLTIDGVQVDPAADSLKVNCGPVPTDPFTGDPLPNQTKMFSATVTDTQVESSFVSKEVLADLVPPLPAPENVHFFSYVADVLVNWDPVLGAGAESPRSVDEDTGNTVQVTGSVRTRPEDGEEWTYRAVKYPHGRQYTLPSQSGLRVLSVAAVRHPLELRSPDALNWSAELTYAATTEAQNVVIRATHDTVTVSWDKQPYAREQEIRVRLAKQLPFQNVFRRAYRWEEEGVSGRHEVVFAALEPETNYKLAIFMIDTTAERGPPIFDVRTEAASPGWSPPPMGPQNPQVTSSEDGHTVTWESPTPHASRTWVLTVTNVVTGREVIATFTHGAKRWVIPLDQLLASTRYRATIHHMDLDVTDRSIEFTTPATGSADQRGVRSAREEEERRMLAFFPVWPVAVDDSYAMTDDPFQWRYYSNQHRFHAGLDIGEHSKYAAVEDQVDGEPVYAVADGVMRVFADDLSKISVFYCPQSVPLHERLRVANGRPGTQWWDGTELHGNPQREDDDPYCQSLGTPSGGRTAFIAHELPGGEQILTKYAHLEQDGFPRAVARELASNFDQCDPVLSARVPCSIEPDRSVRVARGQQIGRVGHSSEGEEHGEFDAHVHFEIRHLNIPGEE